MKSFESLSERWMAQLNDHANSEDLAKLLVGNKSDLGASREVSKETAQKFCQEFGMEMLETSAKSGDNVLQAFEKLVSIVHDRALSMANKNVKGIKGVSTGAAGGGTDTVKLEGGNDRSADANSPSCGC